MVAGRDWYASGIAVLFSIVCAVSGNGNATAQQPKTITNSIGMKLVLIPKGTFAMGAPVTEVGSQDDESQHQVTISKDYYLGIHEVTQAQFKKVTGKNPSQFNGQVLAERIPAKKHPVTGRTIAEAQVVPKDTSRFPVDSVTWDDAVYFCERLSNLPEEKRAGRIYRLPTEAEWEYACRAGNQTAYSFGDGTRLADFCWYYGNSSENASSPRTHPVGEKLPNAWGLFDMHGNAAEWCQDWYWYYPVGAVTDPRGSTPGDGSLGNGRVLRGGSYRWKASGCRSAARDSCSPSYRSKSYGFRVTLSPRD